MASKWMSLSEAYAQARPHYQDAAQAHMGLLTALRRAELVAQADFFGDVEYFKAVRQQRRGVEIPCVFWDLATVDLNNSSAKCPNFWPEPGMPDRPDEYLGAHGVHVSRAHVEEVWPKILPAAETIAATDRTGAPGRPTSSHLVEEEFSRLVKEGNLEKGIGKQAEKLAAWLRSTHPTMAPMTEGTIENAIRVAYRTANPQK